MKIARIHNWPGFRNAELDLIGRMQKVLTGMGHYVIVIDPFGNPLAAIGEAIAGAAPIDGSEQDFCLTVHFNNPQLLDCFSYAANWNPVAFLLRHPVHRTPNSRQDLAYLAACLAGHDVILSAGSRCADRPSGRAERHLPAAGRSASSYSAGPAGQLSPSPER